MKRIENLFRQKQQNILNIYCTAGYPDLESTVTIMQSLQQSGVDMIELGMPYSDPLADGETIQNSSNIALKNGMTISRLFEQLAHMRKEPSRGGVGETFPVVLMGYMNPVLQYGFENFCADAVKVGIDGLILPDMPVNEFENKYQSIVNKYDLDFVFLITPETTETRVRKLDELSSGFLYAVSSSSTTGHEQDFTQVEQYLQRLQGYGLKNPVLVGFGIKDKESFNRACKYTNGAIIGSAFIKALGNTKNKSGTTEQFIKSIIG